ncbi:hypothetical protein I7I48_01358 [Histoplasma ohiense]|nr:hypothetical protein I7I48_01358 [Histoplasma ohiense (nom. inval.)]
MIDGFEEETRKECMVMANQRKRAMWRLTDKGERWLLQRWDDREISRARSSRRKKNQAAKEMGYFNRHHTRRQRSSDGSPWTA